MDFPERIARRFPMKGKTIEREQVASVVRHVVLVQPTDLDLQLSILSRALCISAKACGITKRSFLRELERTFEATDVDDLVTASPAGVKLAANVIGLKPTGLM